MSVNRLTISTVRLHVFFFRPFPPSRYNSHTTSVRITSLSTAHQRTAQNDYQSRDAQDNRVSAGAYTVILSCTDSLCRSRPRYNFPEGR